VLDFDGTLARPRVDRVIFRAEPQQHMIQLTHSAIADGWLVAIVTGRYAHDRLRMDSWLWRHGLVISDIRTCNPGANGAEQKARHLSALVDEYRPAQVQAYDDAHETLAAYAARVRDAELFCVTDSGFSPWKEHGRAEQ